MQVDKHIRKLDQDLKKFEAELQAEQVNKDTTGAVQPVVPEKKVEKEKGRKK